MQNRAGIVSTAVDVLSTGKGKVLLISGPWGCGKTFLWRKEIEPLIKERSTALRIYISCFGVDSIRSLKSQLFTKFLLETGRNVFKNRKAPSGKQLSLGGKLLIKPLIDGVQSHFGAKFIPTDMDVMQLLDGDVIACFDDIERKAETLSIESILGFINALAEQKSFNILMIANEDRVGDLDKYKTIKEKAVARSITIHADIGTTFDLFLRDSMLTEEVINYIKEKRIVITDLFLHSKECNLRSLRRIIDDLGDIRKHGVVLSDDYVASLGSLILENANGRLNDCNFYDFKFMSIEMKKQRRTELTVKEATQEAFVKRYFSGTVTFKHSESIYEFVKCGHIDFSSMSNELFPQESQLTGVDRFLGSLNDFGFFYQSEAQMRAILTQCERYIREEESLSARQLVVLAVYSKSGLELLGEVIDPLLNNRIKERLNDRARTGDDSFSAVVRMHYAGFANYWNEYITVYDSILLPKLEEKAIEAMRPMLEAMDFKQFYEAIIPSSKGLTIFIDHFLNEGFFRGTRCKPDWYHLVVDTVLEEVKKYSESVMPGVAILRAKVNAHLEVVNGLTDIDRMDRYRIGLLLQKCA